MSVARESLVQNKIRSRVNRLMLLLNLQAPKILILKEIELIRKALDELENSLI